jgi:septum formation protein
MMKKLILASASPRRKALLEQIGLVFDVVPSDVPESFPAETPPRDSAGKLAVRKAAQIADCTASGIVIGADTVVVLDGRPLGKPEDPEQAFEMLRALSGKTHEVLTAVAVINAADGRMARGDECTQVLFRELSDREIRVYIASGEPMDKAGAYGIQGKGALLVRRIEGCYTNVVGLPLVRLACLLEEFGIRTL